MGQNTRDIRVWAALAIVYVVWGSTYLGIRITIETIPPMLSGGVRFVLSGLILGLVLALTRGRAVFRMTRAEFLGASVVGVLLLTAGNGMVSVAEKYISSGLAALLVASVPLWLVIFRVAVRDRPHALTVTGVLVGFCGVAGLSLTGGGSGAAAGIVIILCGALAWSVGSFLSGRLPMPKDPFTASTVEMLVGGVVMLAVSPLLGEHVDVGAVGTGSWVALTYLVLVGSLAGFTSYVWLLGNAPISLVSTYAYVNPVVAVVLGVVVLDESVTAQMFAAGAVIVLGVALVVSTERRGRRAGDAAPAGKSELSRS
ncbi:drug/metabolite exporter YedA [Sphaerisporangium krabiense]|uniref:Drug/metabolite transporter (DMT)-like permease n=1 Tax=Sphaerisporangium krabiense TaxID=763782 RepID=A0A7W8Z1I0_9ACTN|nr:EamA family transporter [Sphaerisporangium krabiense]MBB5625707.1 drug/metabolite transporter (DMT)-like permease [Sphaerisporangium krabiense]GII62957.1 drug/metabolite exporter YedA [Sphaerisporangium krabiense]